MSCGARPSGGSASCRRMSRSRRRADSLRSGASGAHRRHPGQPWCRRRCPDDRDAPGVGRGRGIRNAGGDLGCQCGSGRTRRRGGRDDPHGARWPPRDHRSRTVRGDVHGRAPRRRPMPVRGANDARHRGRLRAQRVLAPGRTAHRRDERQGPAHRPGAVAHARYPGGSRADHRGQEFGALPRGLPARCQGRARGRRSGPVAADPADLPWRHLRPGIRTSPLGPSVPAPEELS